MASRSLAWHSSASLRGSIKIPASPTTSANELTLDVIVGAPHCIASRGGRPNPSYSDGKTNPVAPLYNADNDESGRNPVKKTRFRSKSSSSVGELDLDGVHGFGANAALLSPGISQRRPMLQVNGV